MTGVPVVDPDVLLDRLTDQQRAYVLAYAECLDHITAAASAGYASPTTNAHRLKNNPKIQEAVTALLAARQERYQVGEAYVLSSVVEIMERAKGGGPVLDRRGQQVTVQLANGEVAALWASDYRVVLDGADKLARLLGLYEREGENPKADALRRAVEEIMEARSRAPLASKQVKASEPVAEASADG
jgi:hypothetical protein